MKINNIQNLQFRNNSIKKSNSNTYNKKQNEVKSASMILASLLALSLLGEANINTTKTEANNTNNIQNIEKYKHLTNLLQGKETAESNPDTRIFFPSYCDEEANKIINKTSIQELLPHVKNNLPLYAENGISAKTIINKLIEFRQKNMPTNTDKNFVEKSGLFKKYFFDDVFSDNSTKYYYIKSDFCKNIDFICKDRQKKEEYANNFTKYAYEKPNIKLYNQNLSITDINYAIIKLLLPDK